MQDYLLDRQTLAQFVDELMKKRPIPVDNVTEINSFREEQMKALDDHISDAIFGSMSDAQLSSLNQLLDQEKDNPDVFQNFFKAQDIDIDGIVANAVNTFSANYLTGGYNG